MLKFASSLLAIAALAGATTVAVSADQPVIGLITKTDTNPSWGLLPPTLDVQKKRNGAKNPIAAPRRTPMPMPIAIRMR